MPIGTNSGNQLNIFIFETLLVLPGRNPDGSALVQSLCVHPLWVAPATIRKTSPSRSPVTKNADGALRVVGGRNLFQMSFSGTFGVEYRGIGISGGDGELRRRRFEKEVVALGDAANRADVEDAINLFGTQIGVDLAASLPLSKALNGFDPATQGYFAVNLYNFYDREFYQVSIQQYTRSRAHRNAGATGLVAYDMAIQEVGPLLSGVGPFEKILPLLEVTATAQDIMSVVDDVNLTNVLTAAATVVAIPLNVSPIDSLAAGVAKGIRYLGPGGKLTRQREREFSTSLLTANLSSLFGDITRAIDEIRDAVTSIKTTAPPSYEPNQGWTPFETLGFSETEPWVTAYESTTSLLDIEDGLRFSQILGCYYGMSRGDYQAFVEAGGDLGKVGPDILTTVQHVVTLEDSPRNLERQYNVTWDEILSTNGLTPDEALYPETVLRIPQRRPRGNLGVAGLEVFDSHVGDSIYGKDLDVTLVADENGDLLTVTGPDCLEQGLQMISEQYADTIRSGADTIPAVVAPELMAQRLRRLLALDRRVLAVNQVTAGDNGTGTGLALVADVTGIGGDALRVGV